jgi:hypothetical protein
MKNFLGRHGMKYELEWIEQFILNRLLVMIRDNVELSEVEIAGHVGELDEEVERIKIRMRRDTIHLGEGYDTTAYVQLYKEALMQLAGLRYAAPSNERNSLAPGMVTLSQLTFEAIENLLLFLETSFTQLFDLDSRVPEVYLAAVAREARLAADALYDQLQAFTPDPKLLDLALLPFRQLANSRGQDIPYRKVSNLRLLKQELTQLLQSAAMGTVSGRLRVLLHSINFNYTEFFDYCMRDILEQLAGVEGSMEKQGAILAENKLYVEGILVKTKVTFDMAYPPLRHSLLEWIGSRFTDVEHSRSAVVKASTKSGKAKSPADKMITLFLSANESGYFIKLLNRAKLIDRPHFPRLVEVVHANFVSIDGQEMDPENLRKKGYPDNVGVGLMKKVRDLLKRMLAIVEDDIAKGKE